MLKWIEKTDYHVRVIGLVRNPMAVMYSALQLFYTNPENRQFGWVNGNRNILKMAELLGDKFKLVKYEDLVGNARDRFRDICSFIGVDFQEQIGASVHAESLFKWRDDQSFDFQLDESVAKFAHSLGYSEADLFNPPKPKAGPMRRFNRNLLFKIKRVQARLYDKVKQISD